MNTEATRNSRTIVRPRDAASLVVHRTTGRHHEVLMGRRGRGARFKPGVYVFPGGVLERADYAARPSDTLAHRFVAKLAVAGSARKANALAMAAVREAFEEAGLVYGVSGDVGQVTHPSWQEFKRRAVAPALRELDFLGRAITPSHRPLRFHARFFALPYDALSGEIGGDGELEDWRWVRTDRPQSVEMMGVQASMLNILEQRLNGNAAPAQVLFYAQGKNVLKNL